MLNFWAQLQYWHQMASCGLCYYCIQWTNYESFRREVLYNILIPLMWKVKVKWSCYTPSVAQRLGKRIALLFHDRGTSRGWVVSSTSRLYLTPWKDPIPILQEGGWAPGPVWTGGKSRPHRDLIPDHPARSQLLYRLSYLAHIPLMYRTIIQNKRKVLCLSIFLSVCPPVLHT